MRLNESDLNLIKRWISEKFNPDVLTIWEKHFETIKRFLENYPDQTIETRTIINQLPDELFQTLPAYGREPYCWTDLRALRYWFGLATSQNPAVNLDGVDYEIIKQALKNVPSEAFEVWPNYRDAIKEAVSEHKERIVLVDKLSLSFDVIKYLPQYKIENDVYVDIGILRYWLRTTGEIVVQEVQIKLQPEPEPKIEPEPEIKSEVKSKVKPEIEKQPKPQENKQTMSKIGIIAKYKQGRG